MNVKKDKRGHRTVNFAPYGRLPLRDAKQGIAVTLSEKNVATGKKNSPTACAIAQALRDDALENGDLAAVPGFMAVQVKKTATLIARSTPTGIKVERYSHPAGVTRAINGFDHSTIDSLKAGDVARLDKPVGNRRIGKSNGRSNAGNIVPKNPRKGKACVRRGVYLDKVHGLAAKAADPELRVKD